MTQEGPRVSGSGPDSSGFHLEVAASLGDIAFEQEAKAGPFLVDLLINGKMQPPALTSAVDPQQSEGNVLCECGVPATGGSSEPSATSTIAENIKHDMRSIRPRVPRLHPQGHMPRQPWEPRRRTEREILFSVD